MTPRLVASVCAATLIGCGASRPRPMALRRVILYQNGIGYFERSGHVQGGSLRLSFARSELDDVLKTLTVIDRIGSAGVATVDVPVPDDASKAKTIGIDVRLASKRTHDLLVGYAVPTPTWKAAYRVVLDDSKRALLQGWAMINNTSQEDWQGVSLTLATGAPMSFAQDLHTPQYVQRPDATGHLVGPTVLGPIDAEVSQFRDSDGDRIVDVDDKCPNDAESYNGDDDFDGCPDRGRVVVASTNIEILESIVFVRDSDQIAAASKPVLDATAAVLNNNPDITRLEIGGHASADETDPWGLSARRAEAVRAALVARGVAASRLEVTGYAATQPRDAATTAAGNAKNRRVEFLILKRGGELDRQPASRIDTTTASAAVRTRTEAASVAGTVRYALGEPVTIKRGGSTMVSILNTPVDGEDALLYRPDGNAPGSERHPFRAVRFTNSSGFTLEPGPVAIFAGGTFVGDSLLQRLQLGQTTWIPYALDGGTAVSVDRTDGERPIRLVSMQRGVMTVENAGIHTTTYTVAAGMDPPRTIYLRHAKRAGTTVQGLPPRTHDQGDAYLVPLPLARGKTTTLTIEEREPRTRSLAILDANRTELSAYLDGAKLPPELAARIAEATALRKDMGAIEDDLAALRAKLTDVTERAGELRETIKSLDRVSRADDLRKKLVASLTAAVADSDAIARQLAAKSEALSAARKQLQLAIHDLTLEPIKP